MTKTKLVTEDKKISELLEEAISELESLKDEIGEWREKLDENEGLRETQKYSEVEECEDNLDSAYGEIESAVRQLLELLTEEEKSSIVRVSWQKPYGRSFPRWARLGYVIAYLNKVKKILEVQPKYLINEDFKVMVDGLNTSDLDGIDFPGMY